ncbi:MAG: hypothetical protein HKN50_11850 [Gammaproteobacteria bacterium]|nr:hypothetical protein [Gammaproteobacteria bacterium]RZV49588.1 MAG: hypothetical protein EX270_12415 [Pseudomonadales bacterium]
MSSGTPCFVSTLTNNQEAIRLAKLLCGPQKVRNQAQKALDEDDARRAARLATYAPEVNPGDAAARQIRQAAFKRIARTTVSANERNYLRTIIKEENGEINWKRMFSTATYQAVSEQSIDSVLSLMKSRFKAEDANGVTLSVKVQVANEKPL